MCYGGSAAVRSGDEHAAGAGTRSEGVGGVSAVSRHEAVKWQLRGCWALRITSASTGKRAKNMLAGKRNAGLPPDPAWRTDGQDAVTLD